MGGGFGEVEGVMGGGGCMGELEVGGWGFFGLGGWCFEGFVGWVGGCGGDEYFVLLEGWGGGFVGGGGVVCWGGSFWFGGGDGDEFESVDGKGVEEFVGDDEGYFLGGYWMLGLSSVEEEWKLFINRNWFDGFGLYDG